MKTFIVLLALVAAVCCDTASFESKDKCVGITHGTPEYYKDGRLVNGISITNEICCDKNIKPHPQFPGFKITLTGSQCQAMVNANLAAVRNANPTLKCELMSHGIG